MKRLLVRLVLLLPGFCGMLGDAQAAALTVVHEFPMLDKEVQAGLLLANHDGRDQQRRGRNLPATALTPALPGNCLSRNDSLEQAIY